MPSEHQGGDRRERRRFNDPHADEAARWIDQEVIGRPGREKMVRTFIRSIDMKARVRGWLATERRLARLDQRKPRTGIVRALEQREAELAEQGERPDRLAFGPREPCDCCEADDSTAAEVRASRTEEREKRVAGYSPTAPTVGGTEADETETSTLGTFATDGGEPEA